MDLGAKSSRQPYFGYGSNLWQDQMQRRCPGSRYLGLARLSGFRWIINKRGYANIVPSASLKEFENSVSNATSDSGFKWSSLVYGLVYSLTEDDEDQLDMSEGVPYAYTKETMEVEFWPTNRAGSPPEKKQMLIYIDRERAEGGFKPKEEYIYRMNMGIRDALSEGVPKEYFQTVLREYIPETQTD